MRLSQPFPLTARRVSIVLVLALLALCSSLLVSVLAGPGVGPAVTIDQGEEQPDPTAASPIVFTVVFSSPVTGFETGEVTLSGTAGATTATVFDSGDSTFFQRIRFRHDSKRHGDRDYSGGCGDGRVGQSEPAFVLN